MLDDRKLDHILFKFYKRTDIDFYDLYKKNRRLQDVFDGTTKEFYDVVLRGIFGPTELDKMLWVGITILDFSGKSEQALVNTITNGFGYYLCNLEKEKNAKIRHKWDSLIYDRNCAELHLKEKYSLYRMFSKGKLPYENYDRIYLINQEIFGEQINGFNLNPCIIINSANNYIDRLKYDFGLKDEDEIIQFQSYLSFILNDPVVCVYCAKPLHYINFIRETFGYGEIYIAVSDDIGEDNYNLLLYCLEKIALSLGILVENAVRKDLLEKQNTLNSYAKSLKLMLSDVLTDATRTYASVLLFDNEEPRFRISRILGRIDKALMDENLDSSLFNFNKKLNNFLSWNVSLGDDPDLILEDNSLKHYLIWNENNLDPKFEKYIDLINEKIINEIKSLSDSSDEFKIAIAHRYKQHCDELIKYFKLDLGWWPVIGYNGKKDFWKKYISKSIKIDNIDLKIESTGYDGLMMPYFAYLINSLFPIRSEQDENKKMLPKNCKVIINPNDGIVNYTIQWTDNSGKYKDKSPINIPILNEFDIIHKFKSRIWFLSNIFAEVGGEGFCYNGNDISLKVYFKYYI